MKIGDLIKYYFKNFKLVFLIIIILSLIGCLIVSKLHLQYYSESKFILGICSGEVCPTGKYIDYDLNENVINNYLTLIKSDKVIDKAITLSNLDYEISDVKNMINIVHNSENHLVTIRVISKDSKVCNILASNLYESFTEEANRIFNLNNIRLIYKDTDAHVLISRKLMYLGIFAIAFMVSIIVITIKYIVFFNKSK